MDLVGFVKGILIDSLAGISADNLAFIIIQFLAAIASILVVKKLLSLTKSAKTLVYYVVFLSLLVLIAKTSVPLAIVLSFAIVAFILKDDRLYLNDNLSLFFISFCAGSGYLILLLFGLTFIFIFSKMMKKNAS